MKILVLNPFPEGFAAGQRLKYEQYIDDWRESGYDVDVDSFMGLFLWNVLYKKGYLFRKSLMTVIYLIKRLRLLFVIKKYDLIYIHQWVVPIGGCGVEFLFRKFARKIVYDLEDNVIKQGASSVNPMVSFLRRKSKFKFLIKNSDYVITSSPELNQFCLGLNRKKSSVYISSSVNCNLFVPKNKRNLTDKVVLGWTGTFSSLDYFRDIEPAIQELANLYEFKLLMITNFDYELQGVDLEVVRWSKETEVETMQQLDIGLYPLKHDEFSGGKSGLKAIQYMAFGIPTVASNVGNTKNIIHDKVDGFLVHTHKEWVEVLSLLLKDEGLRFSVGNSGRETAVKNFSNEAIKHKYMKVLRQTLGAKP